MLYNTFLNISSEFTKSDNMLAPTTHKAEEKRHAPSQMQNPGRRRLLISYCLREFKMKSSYELVYVKSSKQTFFFF